MNHGQRRFNYALILLRIQPLWHVLNFMLFAVLLSHLYSALVQLFEGQKWDIERVWFWMYISFTNVLRLRCISIYSYAVIIDCDWIGLYFLLLWCLILIRYWDFETWYTYKVCLLCIYPWLNSKRNQNVYLHCFRYYSFVESKIHVHVS